MQICRRCLFALQQRWANERQDNTTGLKITTAAGASPPVSAAMSMFVSRDQSLADDSNSHADSA
jgi:hypothetical protein